MGPLGRSLSNGINAIIANMLALGGRDTCQKVHMLRHNELFVEKVFFRGEEGVGLVLDSCC